MSNPQPPTPLPPNTGPITEEEKSKKLLAGVLGILLGGLGIHKFVLGYNQEGIIHLGVCLGIIALTVITCGLASPLVPIPGIVGLIEGIIYLTKI